MKWLKSAGAWLTISAMALVTVPLLVLILPFVLLSSSWNHAHRWWLRRSAPRRWGGRRILLVYSDSPNWKEYIETKWLPRFGGSVVTLNWSNRRTWADETPFERAVFRGWAGEREFNPLVIGFPRRGPVKVIRLWQPFRDYKHGRDTRLKKAEAELEALVQETGTSPR